MIRVAIIDDEPLSRQLAQARLARVAGLHIVGSYADAETALQGLAQAPAQLLLLDIRMPGLDGFELLAALPRAQRPLVILLTAHAEHALQAFALDVVDYLLKPLDDERLDEALRRVRRRLALPAAPSSAAATPADPLQLFEVRVGRAKRLVRIEAVDWLQADGDYVQLHTADGAHLLRDTLGSLQTRLDPQQFVRVHRSAIVRLSAISEMRALSNRDALLRLHSGAVVRASRSHVEALREKLRLG